MTASSPARVMRALGIGDAVIVAVVSPVVLFGPAAASDRGDPWLTA